MEISTERWHYLRRQAEITGARFLRCGGRVYEARRLRQPHGDPLWQIEEVVPRDIPPFQLVEYGLPMDRP
jgi:hypothetical protein